MSQSSNKIKSEFKTDWDSKEFEGILSKLSDWNPSHSTDSSGFFNPEAGTSLTVDKETYHVTEHPTVPDMAYGLQARRATVYQLAAPDGGLYALKVFNPAWRTPHVANGQLRSFAHLRGLQVCSRTVLTNEHHAALLRQYADLTYAVLMPWIVGETWQEVMLDKKSHFTPELSRALAHALAQILATMEQHHLAHCDLSGANIMVRRTLKQVELIDVEDLYAQGLTRPEKLPSGSPGYAHREAHHGLWSANADRFAGAVLLAEILGWCDSDIREKAYGEQYFALDEMQKECERFQLMQKVLREEYGNKIAEAFSSTWHSSTLAECVPFTEWEQLLRTQDETTTKPSKKIQFLKFVIFLFFVFIIIFVVMNLLF